MKIVAISVDIWLAGEATMGDVLFWTSLIFSPTLGLVVASPILPSSTSASKGNDGPHEDGRREGNTRQSARYDAALRHVSKFADGVSSIS